MAISAVETGRISVCKLEMGKKVYEMVGGSNALPMYHLHHKHPLKYQHLVDSDQQKSSQVQPITAL